MMTSRMLQPSAPNSLRRFFDRVVHRSFGDLALRDDPAADYVSDLLTRFARTETLYPAGALPSQRLRPAVDPPPGPPPPRPPLPRRRSAQPAARVRGRPAAGDPAGLGRGLPALQPRPRARAAPSHRRLHALHDRALPGARRAPLRHRPLPPRGAALVPLRLRARPGGRPARGAALPGPRGPPRGVRLRPPLPADGGLPAGARHARPAVLPSARPRMVVPAAEDAAVLACLAALEAALAGGGALPDSLADVP